MNKVKIYYTENRISKNIIAITQVINSIIKSILFMRFQNNFDIN